MNKVTDDWQEIHPLPKLKPFCYCQYCNGDRCHYWTALGRRMTGLSTPSWCPLPYLKRKKGIQ